MEEKSVREGTRLNKYLSEAGVCSRREADLAVENGEVMIDGKVAVLGDRVLDGQIVTFRGEDVRHNEPTVLIAFHKPKGIVCTAEKKEENNIVDYINYPVRIYPVGRLDKDSRGLILLTNQGDLVNKLNRGGNFHEKEYIVRVDQEVTEEFLEKMKSGIYLPELHVKTRPCKIWKSGEKTFHIILTQGLNRQIRRMCEACGYRVRDLLRVRIMDILLRDLPEGEYRDLTPEETKKLVQSLEHSYSAPKGGSDGRRPGHVSRGYNGKKSTGGYGNRKRSDDRGDGKRTNNYGGYGKPFQKRDRDDGGRKDYGRQNSQSKNRRTSYDD